MRVVLQILGRLNKLVARFLIVVALWSRWHVVQKSLDVGRCPRQRFLRVQTLDTQPGALKVFDP